jgi:uncharacterized protein YjaG (DUF416 family)
VAGDAVEMIARFDEMALAAALDRLPEPHRTVFAAACAERLMPAYDAFATRSGRGDPKALSDILARLWDDLAGNAMTSAQLQSLIDDCMKLIPREDEVPWVPEQPAAEDAGAAVAYALRCRQNGRGQEAAWSARRSYEAQDHCVINREGINVNVQGSESRVAAHPAVQVELARQRRDLDDLSNTGDPRDAAARLRARAKTESMSFAWSRH